MYQRNPGLMFGEIDQDGIAEYYPKCKVRKEGDVFIATPYTTHFTKRRKRRDKPIAVTITDGKYKLEEMPKAPVVEDLQAEDLLLEEVVEDSANCSNNHSKPPVNAPQPQITTRKQVFDELYAKYSHLKPHERKQAIYKDMLPLFNSKESAQEFVDKHWSRHRRNNYCRKKRFEYKALNQDFQYFFTITFDSAKHNEVSFEKSLRTAFSNLHKRYNCLFQGVWERGNENDRLHFHGIMCDPQHKIVDGLYEVTDYNPKTGRQKTFLQSKYFLDKFGRNEFREIIPLMYHQAINYITKYISKQGVKPYYSKGLYRFVETDICGEDVICKMDETGRDNRLIVAKDFAVLKDGEYFGRASPETLKHLPKLP